MKIELQVCGNGHTHLKIDSGEDFEMSGIQPLWPQLQKLGFTSAGPDCVSPATQNLASPVQFRGERFLMELDYYGNPMAFTSI